MPCLLSPESPATRIASTFSAVKNSMYRRRLKKFSPETGGGTNHDSAMRAELRRLREENKRLLMEREILKKATAFFAKQQP